jgi:hypothetical protein
MIVTRALNADGNRQEPRSGARSSRPAVDEFDTERDRSAGIYVRARALVTLANHALVPGPAFLQAFSRM